MKYLPLGLVALGGLSLAWSALASSQAPSAAKGLATDAQTETTPLLSNVRFIGASITAGFGNAGELKLGINTPLNKFFRAALADHNQGATVKGSGSNTYYTIPQSMGARDSARARAASPTLVIALDFLFWYGFGLETKDAPRRAKGLALGLKELEAFECPIIIGTLPNIDHALKGVGPLGGPVVFPRQFPTESERISMNETILKWAATRSDVQVVDVDGMFRSLIAGEPLSLRGQEWKLAALSDALQSDLLHLSLDGYTWTVLALADAIAKLDGASEDDFVFDLAKIRERFLASIAQAQAKQAERTAKRLAREAAREARRKERAIK